MRRHLLQHLRCVPSFCMEVLELHERASQRQQPRLPAVLVQRAPSSVREMLQALIIAAAKSWEPQHDQ